MKDKYICSDMTEWDSFYDAQLHQNLLNELYVPTYLYGMTGKTDNK